MADPKITPTYEEKSCCSSGGCCGNKCGGNTCCSKGNLRASIGRIAVGVILLGSMFVFGMQAGMMGDRGGRDKKGEYMMGGGNGGCGMDKMGGCAMDKMGGCGMMDNNYMNNKGNTVTPPAPEAEVIPVEPTAPEAPVAPAPEVAPTVEPTPAQ